MTLTEELILMEAKPGFVEKGVQIQFSSRSLNDAIRNYEKSCERCTMTRNCNGHACSIERAFIYNTKKFSSELLDPAIRLRVENALRLDA